MGKQMRNKQSASAMSFENAHPSNPGCAWSILHIIKYNHWRQVKKRLVHRKLSSGRTSAGSGIPINDDASGSGKIDEHDDAEMINSNVHDKVAHSTPAAKHSVRSRIKALITDELSKKKGRHKRSSTCPERSQLARTDSIHHLEHSDLDPLADMVLIDGSPKTVPEIIEEHLSINESDPVPPMFSEEPSTSFERCLECGIMFTSGDKAGYNLAHKHQPSEGLTHFQEMLKNENQDILENKSINARILATDAPAHHFKDFLDALDIINVNKDLLLKLLQDPGSPLAQHFHNQHAFTAKMGLTKSVSFPLRGSSSRAKGSDPSILIKNLAGSGSTPYVEGLLQIGSEAPQSAESKSTEFFYRRSMSSSAGYKVDGILSFNQAMAERGYNPTSGLARGQNQVVTKRFKNLRQKIKHVIRESRKERRRITMDAILHKIPRGHELPKESKKESAKEGKDSPASGYESDLSSHSITKRQMHRMRRTSSLNESLDRYCQLYETSFNREAKHANSERLELKMGEDSPLRNPKTFIRIFSLPDLESYFYQSEEFSDALFTKSLIRTSGDGTMSMESTTNEPKSLDPSVDSRSQLELYTSVDNKKEENFCKVNGNDSVIENDGDSKSDATNEVNAKVGLTREDSGSLISVDCASCDQLEIGPERKDNAIAAEALKDTTSFEEFSTSEESELNPKLSEGMDNSAEQHQASMDTPKVAESKADYQTFEILSKQGKYGIPQLQVDAKDKAKFDFVRDVLELSGLSGHDSIGTWHFDDQPIDPSVYEEIEGCLLLDPDCSGNEESGHCNHMLLFDLINEVLVEIYGRSYSYCPTSLSSLCSIRLMPAGNHVLREVWSLISWYLSLRSEADQPLDYVVSRDLAKGDGWMNLQFETECVGLELEDLIIDDLLEEFLQE